MLLACRWATWFTCQGPRAHRGPLGASNRTAAGLPNPQRRRVASDLGLGGAACRNRTDDLLITRRTYSVAYALCQRFWSHGHPHFSRDSPRVSAVSCHRSCHGRRPGLTASHRRLTPRWHRDRHEDASPGSAAGTAGRTLWTPSSIDSVDRSHSCGVAGLRLLELRKPGQQCHPY